MLKPFGACDIFQHVRELHLVAEPGQGCGYNAYFESELSPYVNVPFTEKKEMED